MSQDPTKPKLIIDEDWKTQVEREREALRQAPAATSTPESDAQVNEPVADQLSESAADHATPATGAESSARSADDLPPPPPASFPFLVSMLGTQALAAMGQLGDEPGTPPPRLDYAKHYIDLLGLLEQKTKGNLATEEYDLLADWLHQLRMTFVNMSKRP